MGVEMRWLYGEHRLFRKKGIIADKDGVAAVEFAMLVFPLTVLLMGVINFGYAFFGFNQIQATANDTIRAITYGGLTDQEAEVFAITRLQRFGGEALTITIDDSSPQSRTLTISGGTGHLTLVDFPYASLSYYEQEFTISSVAPKFKMSSSAGN